MKCPCGSGKKFSDCCEKIIDDQKLAKTAEALMRARYSAFALGKIDFLRDSLAPESRIDFDPEVTSQWAQKSKWLGLTIVSKEKGEESDSTGIVEFTAEYSVDDKVTIHHETSEFRKESGSWFFVDGKVKAAGPVQRETPKIGRNDPCTCGSGKKYKKCCAA